MMYKLITCLLSFTKPAHFLGWFLFRFYKHGTSLKQWHCDSCWKVMKICRNASSTPGLAFLVTWTPLFAHSCHSASRVPRLYPVSTEWQGPLVHLPDWEHSVWLLGSCHGHVLFWSCNVSTCLGHKLGGGLLRKAVSWSHSDGAEGSEETGGIHQEDCQEL